MNEINISDQVVLLKENENNPKAFFEQLETIFRDEISELIFEEYTKDKEIDIFEMASKAIKDGVDIFSISFLLEKLAKYSICHLDSLKLLFLQMNELMKNDMALGVQYRIMTEIVKKDIRLGKDFLAYILDKNEDWSIGYASAIYTVLFDENREKTYGDIIKLAYNDNANFQIIAIQALSSIDYNKVDKQKIEEVYNIFIRLQELQKNELDLHIINSVKFLIQYSDKFQNLIVKYSQYSNENIKYQLSHLLFMICKKNSNEKWFIDVLFTLTNTSSEFSGTINNLRMIFNILLKDEKNINIVIDFIFTWLINSDISDNQKELKEFVEFILPKLSTNKIVALGLNHDDSKINKVMKIFVMHDTILDKNIMKDFNDNDYIYILRRIIGYMIGFKEQIQLIFSILQVDTLSDNIKKNIEHIIVQYIYKDYPIDTIDYLREVQKNTSYNNIQKQVAKKLLKHLQDIEKQYKTLPKLQELKSSTHNRRLVYNANRKIMQEAMKKADDASFFRSLTTTIHLKYGKGSFGYFQGAYQEPSYLKPFSHSVTLPNSEIINPVDAALQRYQFNNAKRGKK